MVFLAMRCQRVLSVACTSYASWYIYIYIYRCTPRTKNPVLFGATMAHQTSILCILWFTLILFLLAWEMLYTKVEPTYQITTHRTLASSNTNANIRKPAVLQQCAVSYVLYWWRCYCPSYRVNPRTTSLLLVLRLSRCHICAGLDPLPVNSNNMGENNNSNINNGIVMMMSDDNELYVVCARS